MQLLEGLSNEDIALLCLIFAGAALLVSIILTIIHYISGMMCGFVCGLAAGTHAWWPMLQEWARDVMIPMAVSAASILMWGGLQIYERFQSSGIMERF